MKLPEPLAMDRPSVCLPRRIAASFAAAILAVMAAPQPAAAQGCAGPACDPNWAFQNQLNAQRAQEQAQMEAHMRQMDQYYSGESGSPSPSGPPPEPPRYEPPPPPRGWQSRYTGFVSFKVAENEDREPAGDRYDYALAMNYPTEAEARAAATRLCRERVLRRWEAYDIDYKCESDTLVYRNAFLTLVNYSSGPFGLYEQPTMELAINQHGHAYDFGGRTYYCASNPGDTPANCQSVLFALGRNGVHRQPDDPSRSNFVPCPEGSIDPMYKIVGVDRISGSEVPLCGPDPVALKLKDLAGRWDAYATHPRYVVPFAVGGFSDVATARTAALEMCNRFTGGGCVAAGEAKDGFAVWVRNEQGRLFLGTGQEEETALLDAQGKCSGGQVLPCMKVISRMTGDLRVYGPRYKPGDLRYFGAVALPGGKVGPDREAWVAMNMETQEDADRYALQACQSRNQAKAPCQIVGRGLGTRFFAYSGLDGSRGVFTLMVRGSGNLIDLQNRESLMLKALCEPKGTLCKTEGAIDASDDGEGRQPDIQRLTWPMS